MAVTLEQIKRWVIIALASDDQLMETLVLKGGNAIELLQQNRPGSLSRSSFDLDFSIADDFDDELEEIKARMEKTITATFAEQGLQIFDFNFVSRPAVIREQMKNFWGGYNIVFKITTPGLLQQYGKDPAALRRHSLALAPTQSRKVEIEISKYEYVGDRKEIVVDGFRVHIYSPEMIVFEKLRALCQQLEAYGNIIPSFRPRPRARDFYDIHLIMEQFGIVPGAKENKELMEHIFAAKRVPLSFIGDLHKELAIHQQNWQEVLETLPATEEVQGFDFYVQYVLDKFQGLTFP